MVKSMMLMKDDANYKLSYKTGWGTTEKGNQLGWIIGWIEETNDLIFLCYKWSLRIRTSIWSASE